MSNFMNAIQSLETSISQTEEFQKLKGAVEIVRNDEQARTIFTQFRDAQLLLQQKQMQGEELQEDEFIHLQKTAQLAQQNPKIMAMLEAEMALSRLIDEVNRSLIKPIQSLYDGL
ncbi:YlbF family regulator [Ureibacillus sp. FSL K6-8385]|uniref:Uncharacterized protein n=1 Tax=Ureibacillus terrenus TaxID=118246 RepID=A0A540V228_9BACL|nr:YlbF family regulator [Ureibacillus terrenus]MED3661075.1 YlbF family regulator [Ureibacillus terrenus]MED3763364.1 YlbF family regulator [Ureibacillus terrenus]TQE90777.1 hypothetical protein FKZ59_08480 [Ureibacillus terrenus]